jgi:hypothetical protein
MVTPEPSNQSTRRSIHPGTSQRYKTWPSQGMAPTLEPVVLLFFFRPSLQSQPSFSQLPDLHHMDFCIHCSRSYKHLSQHIYDHHSIPDPVSVLGKMMPVERQNGSLLCPSPTCNSKFGTRSSWLKHFSIKLHEDVIILSKNTKRSRGSDTSIPEEPSSYKRARPAATQPQWQANRDGASLDAVESEASMAMQPQPFVDASPGNMVESHGEPLIVHLANLLTFFLTSLFFPSFFLSCSVPPSLGSPKTQSVGWSFMVQ